MPKVTNNELQKIGEMAIEAICTIYDPEIPVNIYELGLIYDVKVSEDRDIKVLMTLTSPSCPVAETLPQEVKEKVGAVEGVRSADVEITWDPPWNKTLMSEEARLELGFL